MTKLETKSIVTLLREYKRNEKIYAKLVKGKQPACVESYNLGVREGCAGSFNLFQYELKKLLKK